MGIKKELLTRIDLWTEEQKAKAIIDQEYKAKELEAKLEAYRLSKEKKLDDIKLGKPKQNSFLLQMSKQGENILTHFDPSSQNWGATPKRRKR